MQLASLVHAALTVPTDECVLWKGPTLNGYGHFKWLRKQRRTHRLAYEIAVGEIPAGFFVCHRCDVRNCVNPRHLFLGTAADNNADARAKGRANFSGLRSPGAGESCPAAVLSAADVGRIRADGRSQRVLARVYGISKSQVGRIKRGESWAHQSGLPA